MLVVSFQIDRLLDFCNVLTSLVLHCLLTFIDDSLEIFLKYFHCISKVLAMLLDCSLILGIESVNGCLLSLEQVLEVFVRKLLIRYCEICLLLDSGNLFLNKIHLSIAKHLSLGDVGTKSVDRLLECSDTIKDGIDFLEYSLRDSHLPNKVILGLDKVLT